MLVVEAADLHLHSFWAPMMSCRARTETLNVDFHTYIHTYVHMHCICMYMKIANKVAYDLKQINLFANVQKIWQPITTKHIKSFVRPDKVAHYVKSIERLSLFVMYLSHGLQK